MAVDSLERSILDDASRSGKRVAKLDPTRQPLPRQLRSLAIQMAFSDAFCLVLALLTSYAVFFGHMAMPTTWLWMVMSAPLLWCAVFYGFRLYSTHLLSNWEEFRATISASGIGIFIVMMVSFWSKSSFSRAWIGLTWALVTVLELVNRKLWRRHTSRLRVKGNLTFRTLIVGANHEADRLARHLGARHLGFEPLGYVTTRSIEATANHIPVLGTLNNLSELIHEHGVECLFVASTAVGPEDMFSIAQAARAANVQVKVSANLPQMLTSRVAVQEIGNVMMLSLRPVTLTPGHALMKRIFDLAVASGIVLLSLPIFLIVAAAIKLTSPGPVLFRQRRATRGGRFFSIYKFRTMRTGADALLGEEVDLAQPFFKMKSDPRVTPVGRFVRRWSLDEIPQLLNVLKGEMSLVGPRPLPEQQVTANLELLGPRLEVPAGMTGWWQIQGRNEVDPEEALRMDLFYIENWSLSLDAYIVLKTIGVLVTRRGAY